MSSYVIKNWNLRMSLFLLPSPQVLYYDLDGTLTGSVGGWATPNSELHPPQHCTKSIPEFSLNPIHPGTVCTRDVHFLRMALNQATPLVWNRVYSLVLEP